MKPIATPISEEAWSAMDTRERENALALLGISPDLAQHLLGKDRAGPGQSLAAALRRAARNAGKP